MSAWTWSATPEEGQTHDRKRKKTPARGIHHRSSFLCHTREIGLLRKLRGLRAGCGSAQSMVSICTSQDKGAGRAYLGDLGLVFDFEILRDQLVRLREVKLRVSF